MGTNVIQTEDRLGELESIIEKNIIGFYATGMALAEIREENYYIEKGYETFEMYCKYEWDMGRNYANRLISSSDVVKNLEQNGANWHQTEADFITNSDKKAKILPINEAQTRPLTRLTSEKQITAWQKVLEVAKDGRISAALVARIVQEIIDGKLDKKINEIKERIDRENVFTKSFKVGIQSFVDVICDARAKDWKENSKKAVLKHIDAVREIVLKD